MHKIAFIRININSNNASDTVFQVCWGADSCNGVQGVKYDLSTLAKLSNLTNHEIVSRQFRKFFQSYALAFNKQHNRIGTLFQTPFKRVLIDNINYFTQVVYYIHKNPQHHKLVDDFKDWNWSSYGSILSDKPSKIKREEVINWYAGKNNYEKFHLADQIINPNEKYILEDD